VLRAVVVAAVIACSLLVTGVAQADYTGTVDPTTDTVTLTGSGPLVITTSGGLLEHSMIGMGFASATDFDSTQGGVQTVPDTGGWTVDVTGSGTDSLQIDEGEPTSPVSYSSGYTSTPGGVPCIVRDPNDRMGVIAFSEHRAVETWFCYPSGINNVTVQGGSGSVQFGVLDTAPGVPLNLDGGSGPNDQMGEALNTPDGAGGFLNPASPVTFTAGTHPAQISYEDGPTTDPARYMIGNDEIDRAGLPPLYFSAPRSLLIVYPQTGPSTLDIGPTGGDPVQVMGDSNNQTGPDVINGRRANARLYVQGSLGNDTIYGGPVGGGYLFGGGGNPTIYADINDQPQDVACAPQGSRPAGTAYVTHADKVTNCAHVHYVRSRKALRHPPSWSKTTT
jgi:hypothetical protein